MIGGIDEDYFTGPITYTPVTREAYWEFRTQGYVSQMRCLHFTYPADEPGSSKLESRMFRKQNPLVVIIN